MIYTVHVTSSCSKFMVSSCKSTVSWNNNMSLVFVCHNEYVCDDEREEYIDIVQRTYSAAG